MQNNRLELDERCANQLAVIVRNHSIVLFFLLSYAISWTLWIVSTCFNVRILEVAGRFGPLVSAVIIVSITYGKAGIKKLCSRLFVKGVNAKWYILSLFGPVVIVLPAIYINQFITGNNPNYNDPNKWYLIIIAFFYVLFLSVLGEETGWRGYALPKLLERFDALTSSLIIGVIWGFWHLPLFYIDGEFHQMIPFWMFMIDNIALSVIMTWLYKNTKGSLLIAHLFHTASNVTLGILPILPMDTNGDFGALYIAFTILIIVTMLIIFMNRELFAKRSNKSIRKK